MGKSTILQNLSFKIKKDDENKWVILILLNQFAKQFSEAKSLNFDPESAIDFVFKNLLNHDSLEHSLFKTLLTKGKLILLIDGFHTICPNYDDIVLSLILNLSEKTLNQLWISTRETHKLLDDYLEREIG